MVNNVGHERIKLSMHFNHPRHSVDYVCNFVLQASVCGWQIEVNENFNTASILVPMRIPTAMHSCIVSQMLPMAPGLQ